MKEKYNMKEKLLEADERLKGDHSIEGRSMLTTFQYNNAMRNVMFSSHMNQFKTQLHPNFPQFFMGTENLVGKYSDGYKKQNESTVFRKIVKFEDIVENPTVYLLFVYNHKKKRFELITRKPNEDLVEVFGYRYNNDRIDELEEGDNIPEGDILYKSTSYDENMNYSYGKDIITMLSLEPFTSEDACFISDELCDPNDGLFCVEPEYNIATLNDNDFPLNLYGDEDVFKTFPDIGEFSNGIALASRRKFNNQVLVDFQDTMLRKTLDSDTKYYIEGKLVDLDVYCNNEDLKDNSFYHQIYKYWKSQNKYYKKIVETCEEIFQTGEKYHRDIDYIYDRAKKMLDLKDKWKEKDTGFSNIQIHMLFEREVGPTVGQKIAGRDGNKSVISEIRPKSEMPYFYDINGNRVYVQMVISLLQVINRTIAGVIMEFYANFVGRKFSDEMKKKKTMKEKEKLLFDLIKEFNKEEYDWLWGIYSKLDTTAKKDFLNYCENEKIHLHQPPIGEKEPFFYRALRIYEKYEDILQPDDIYIEKWGREIKCIQKGYVSNMYTILLKQTGKKGFSVRGMGAISAKGIPERSYKSKSHKDLYSSTAIRFGEFENLNFCLGMMPEEVVLVNAFYRTSVKARKDLGKALLHNRPVIDMDKTYDSRVAQFFSIILKSLGFELNFLDSDDDLCSMDNHELKWYPLQDGKSVICTEYQKYLLDRRNEIAQELLEEYGILNKDELNEMIDEEIESRDYLIGVYDENKEMYKNCLDLPLPERQPQSMEEINAQIDNLIDVEVNLDD